MSTFEQGNATYEAGDYEAAFAIFLPLATMGDIRAQISVASMYLSGYGIQQSFSEAARWYRPAAEQGHSLAQNSLAIVLFDTDPEEAIRWLFAAAEKGVPFAQSMLGDIYSNLYGGLPSNIQTKNDSSEAAKWYQKAGENGFPYAYHRLGEMFANGQELEKDEEQALRYYRSAAEEGYEPSQEALGRAYAEGLLSLPKDFEQAQYWITQAQQGNGRPLN
jgi:TPR repeat protein